jgi:TatA/E family protein of Tat protein translocase
MIVGVVVLVFFGPKRLPEVAKNLGQGIRDFKKALEDEKTDPTKQLNTSETKKEETNA